MQILVKPSVSDVSHFLAGLKPNDHTSEFIQGQIYRKHIPQDSEIYLQAQLWDALNAATPHPQQAIAYPNHRCSFGGWSMVLDLAIFLKPAIPASSPPTVAVYPEEQPSENSVPDTELARNIHFHSPLSSLYTRYPDWMIEILTPEQDAIHAIRTALHCLAYGTQMVWLIDLNNRLTFVFTPHQTPQEFRGQSPLPTPAPLNLTLTVDQILRWIPSKINLASSQSS